MIFAYFIWMLIVYFVYILLLFVHSFHFITHVFLGTHVIVQAVIGEPLKALMLLCRGNLSDTDGIYRFIVVNLLRH